MDDVTQAVEEAVQKAAKRVMEIYHSDFEVYRKNDGSALTAADLAAHNILKEHLTTYGWPVLSEESKDDSDRLNAEKVWIIDPIDGTNGFVKKTGDFAIQVGLVENGKPIFGVVYMPVSDSYYYAEAGSGAFLKREGSEIALRTRNVADIADAVLVVSASHYDDSIKKKTREFGIESFIHIGGVGTKIGLIAEQKADVYITTTDKLGEWDICAPHIILEEAGGIVTGLHGEEITYNNEDPHNPHGVLAAAGSLHPLLLEQIEGES